MKAGVASPGQQESESSGIAKVKAAETSLLTDSSKEADEDMNENPNDSQCYHKNNSRAVFTLAHHLAGHILMKVQGIESAKLMSGRLKKLYGTTRELKSSWSESFNIFCQSAGNMHTSSLIK